MALKVTSQRFPKHCFLSNTKTTSHPSQNIKIQSLHVKELDKSMKRRSIFRWLHNQKYQFAFLQETHTTIECAQFWEAEWGGRAFFSHGSSNSKGVRAKSWKRYYWQKWKTYSTWLNAPNDVNQQLTFFRSLQNLLAEFAHENIVVAGILQLRPDGNGQEGRKLDFKKSSRCSGDQTPHQPVWLIRYLVPLQPGHWTIYVGKQVLQNSRSA